MVTKKINIKNFVAVLTLLVCLIFIILALYVYFILKRASLQNLIMIILFFGTGVIVEIITLTSKHEGWFAKKQDLSRKQNIIMAVCSFVFGFCLLGVALISRVHISLRIILFIGFLFFGIGSIILLIKELRKE